MSKYFEECEGKGVELLDYISQPSGYGLYKFKDCQHQQLIQYVHVRDSIFKCRTCYNIDLENAYRSVGLDFVSAGSSPNLKIVRFKYCGHVKEVSLSAIRRGQVDCSECRWLKWVKAAELSGLEVISPFEGDYRRLVYKLPCGHIQDMQKGNAARGNFKCGVCNIQNKTSKVYLMKIVSKKLTWIKIGYSLDIDRRISQYGLFDDAVVEVIRCVALNSRKKASKVESSIHKRLTLYSKDSSFMEALMLDGYTECYEIHGIDEIINVFDEEILKHEQDYALRTE